MNGVAVPTEAEASVGADRTPAWESLTDDELTQAELAQLATAKAAADDWGAGTATLTARDHCGDPVFITTVADVGPCWAGSVVRFTEGDPDEGEHAVEIDVVPVVLL